MDWIDISGWGYVIEQPTVLIRIENNENLDMDSCAHLSPADRNHVAVRTTHLVISKLEPPTLPMMMSLMAMMMSIRMKISDNYNEERPDEHSTKRGS